MIYVVDTQNNRLDEMFFWAPKSFILTYEWENSYNFTHK